MEHQFRRGIYRPNAQRLSLSLAPLVAQRSLLFRVKADLATKTNYSELTPTDELESAGSPALFVVTASASARILSAARSAILSGALSSCSVYSQDSWQGPSPFIHKAASPLPVHRGSKGLLQVDSRRHAIAFSPSVQWESMSDESDSSDQIPVMKASPKSAQSVKHSATQDGTLVTLRDACPDTNSILEGEEQLPKNVLEPQMPMKLAELDGGPASMLKKRNSAANRVSKHAKAFGKAISHLSMQPSKKDTAKEDSRRLTVITANIKHLGPEYKFPSLRIQVSPIRTSFINKPSAFVPIALVLPQVVAEKDGASAVVDVQNANAVAVTGVRPRPPRSIRPTTLMYPQAPTTLAPPPIMPFKKGHKRYNSSPAVTNFNFNAKGWAAEDVPPLPAMPSFVAKANSNSLPVRPRAASVATHGHVRAISVPFPTRPRQSFS